MPELPEVETVCRGIEQKIIGKKIESIYTSNKNLRLPFPDNLIDLEKQKITSVFRRARYILIEIGSAGRAMGVQGSPFLGGASSCEAKRSRKMGVKNNYTLLVHLGMSGKLLYLETLPKEFPEEFAKHDHFVIRFDDGSGLIYNDPRRFGVVDLVMSDKINQHKMLKNLGVEPLTKAFTSEYLQQKLKSKNLNIKTAMMDNATVVGVGNIYINESLFESRISPLKPAGNLSLQELENLVTKIKNILSRAIKLGGSTLRDYVQLNGDVGGFQFDFKVYGREGKNCPICSGKIKKIKQNGRSTFYCPSCQKA